jgi:hypothetical protein
LPQGGEDPRSRQAPAGPWSQRDSGTRRERHDGSPDEMRPAAPAEAGGPARGSAPNRTAPGPATLLTARGAAVAMFWLFFVGTLAAGWLHLGVLTGLSFVAGCSLAARYTRRDGLLTVVATPAPIFLITLVITEALTTHAATPRRTLESVAEGTVLTLAGVAPWLFGGVALGLVIAMTRGLRQCLRDLAAELRGDLPSPERTTRPGDGRLRPSRRA